MFYMKISTAEVERLLLKFSSQLIRDKIDIFFFILTKWVIVSLFKESYKNIFIR